MEIKTFSPKELAEVIGVSESSIKRWGDSGLIEMSRTAGGHRRIGFHAALRFIREQEMQIVRPDLIGLPDLEALPRAARAEPLSEDMLYHLLKEGQAVKARGLIALAYLDGMPLATLFDGPLAGALRRLGTLWHENDAGIFVEHTATSTCIEAINQVRLLIPTPPEQAPVALGGAPFQDPYLLPSLMVTAVLADLGYRTVNLGPNTPASTFLHAAAAEEPRLVWVALKNALSPSEHEALAEQVLTPLLHQDVEVVLGGHGLDDDDAPWPNAVHVLDSMNALADFARKHAA